MFKESKFHKFCSNFTIFKIFILAIFFSWACMHTRIWVNLKIKLQKLVSKLSPQNTRHSKINQDYIYHYALLILCILGIIKSTLDGVFYILLVYHNVQNSGGGKLWWIWQNECHSLILPKFYYTRILHYTVIYWTTQCIKMHVMTYLTISSVGWSVNNIPTLPVSFYMIKEQIQCNC